MHCKARRLQPAGFSRTLPLSQGSNDGSHQERREADAAEREAPAPQPPDQEGDQGPAQELPGGFQDRDGRGVKAQVNLAGEDATQGAAPRPNPPKPAPRQESAA